MTSPRTDSDARLVYIVDDDAQVREALVSLLRSIDLPVQAFASTEAFLATPPHAGPSCLVLDVRLRGESGLNFQGVLATSDRPHLPVIFISGHGDIAMSVRVMKAGAVDFLPKPFRDQDLIDAVFSALERDARRLQTARQLHGAQAGWNALTAREREVIQLVAEGLMNKQIAARMEIAEVTAKIHRGHAMRKMNAHSVAELVRTMEALGVLQNVV